MTNRTAVLRRLGLLTAAVTTAAVAFAPLAAADPRADAQAALDKAKAAALDAAVRYSAAETEQARLEAEIARLENEIPELRAHADELKLQVQQRAVQLYREGNTGALSRLLAAEDAQAAARANELTSTAANHDRELAAELTRTARKLEHEEEDLKARKAEQDALLAQLAKLRDVLNQALFAADVAVKKLDAIAASQQEFAGSPGAAAGQVATGATACPVAGPVVFTNDWGAPRSGGRTHQGNDMFAAMGTPDVALVNGWVEDASGGLGGIAVRLHGDDGVDYYYAHLQRIEGPARRVNVGDVIGYVGDTGNAAGGPPHTHFQIEPGGGEPINPYPTIRALCLQ